MMAGKSAKRSKSMSDSLWKRRLLGLSMIALGLLCLKYVDVYGDNPVGPELWLTSILTILAGILIAVSPKVMCIFNREPNAGVDESQPQKPDTHRDHGQPNEVTDKCNGGHGRVV